MKIEKILHNKKRFIDLLLLADEQESIIDRYLESGEMYALVDDGVKSICVVTCEGDGVFEIKNIATYQKYQGMGYGKKMIEYLFAHYKGICNVMLVGTGDSPRTVQFYEKCGFVFSHKIKNFFIENYDNPIFEDGIQLIDMLYFKREM